MLVIRDPNMYIYKILTKLLNAKLNFYINIYIKNIYYFVHSAYMLAIIYYWLCFENDQ